MHFKSKTRAPTGDCTLYRPHRERSQAEPTEAFDGKMRLIGWRVFLVRLVRLVRCAMSDIYHALVVHDFSKGVTRRSKTPEMLTAMPACPSTMRCS